MSAPVHVVVGGQFGSESKGAVAAKLTREYAARLPVLVRVAGPNAGHTAYDDQGRKWALRQIPCAAVVNHEAPLVIAAGSEISVDVVASEATNLEAAGIPVWNRLYIDHQATIIEDHHHTQEAVISTGTTSKGIGAARSARILREATLAQDFYAPEDREYPCLEDTARFLERCLAAGRPVIIEGTQGFGLGSHAGYYPFTTSSNCRAIDFLAMAGLSPWSPLVNGVFPWVVVRPHPIRIAGNSGPLKEETTWEALGQPPEYTTVTQKVRRVGEWDRALVVNALRANGGPRACILAFGFLDYIFPDDAGKTDFGDLSPEARAFIDSLSKDLGSRVGYIGTGPDTAVFL